MISQTIKFFLLFSLFANVAEAQNPARKFESAHVSQNTLEVLVSDGRYVLKPYDEDVLETTFIPSGETFDSKSHAVVAVPQKVRAKKTESKNNITFSTSGISATIIKSPFQIIYSYKGKVLLSEKDGFVKKDSAQAITFNLDTTETLYGGGARALPMNRRGNRLQLYNRASYGYGERADLMNFCIPMVLSSKIYAVHFDNPAIGYLDLDSKKDNTLAYEAISGRKTYQVMASNSWTDLISEYTWLTGRQPLPPRWALGNFSSRFGYHDQDEVMHVADKFAQDSIPVDALILDLFWFGKEVKGTMGNLAFDRDKFPDPDKMISDLSKRNIKTILITEPFVLTTSNRWKEAVSNGVLATTKNGQPATWDFYFGNTGIVDVFKPAARDWFWQIYKNLVNRGVGGWWGDLGEPEVFPSKVMTAAGKADVVHNIYGHQWAKMIYDGYEKDFPRQRPFILMRAGYSGSQRFGMIPWSGDVSRSWGGLQSQPSIALQMGMQGIGYMHSDLGGFAGDYFDNELYLRWLQYGVFQPVFRPHAQGDVAPEVALKDVVTKAAAKKLVELRYQMLPYNYTIAFENHRSGIPLMRPLFFDEPTNSALLTKSNSYLWGSDFLVTPIMTAGQTSVSVYFPKASSWTDFYTGEVHQGESDETVATVADHIPVFVRGGAFVPMIATIQNTSKYSLSQFDLHFYADSRVLESHGELYDDDGATPDAFENGKYELMHFSSKSTTQSTVITLTSELGRSFAATTKNINLILHNSKSGSGKITIDGKSATFKSFENHIELPVLWPAGKNVVIKIEH